MFHHQFSLFELLPYILSILIKLLSFAFSDRYSLAIARNLDTSLSSMNLNHPELKERSYVASEATSRLSLFIALLVSGLSTAIICVKNNHNFLGVSLAGLILFGLLIFYLLAEIHNHERYFSKNAIIIICITILLDLGLLAVSYFSSPKLQMTPP